MVEDEPLNIAHDLPIALMCIMGHGEQQVAPFIVHGRGMRVQHKRDGQQAFDPLNLTQSIIPLFNDHSFREIYQLVPSVGL